MEMILVATGTLIAGLVDDLRSRKVHNALVLVLGIAATMISIFLRGFEGSWVALMSLGLALFLTIPLFAVGVIGGGDVKLFAVFSFCVTPQEVFSTLVFSFIWGALFGLTRAAVQNRLPSLVRNTYRMTTFSRERPQEIHKIPFTFAMLLGWLTQMTISNPGGLS